MSIFLEQHHDTLLLEYLSIDDLVILSQVSKYYYKLTKDILQPFRECFKSDHEIRIWLCDMEYIDIDADMFNQWRVDRTQHCDLINACVYNNLNVVKYVIDKHKKTFGLLNVIEIFEHHISSISCNMYDLLIMISIRNNNINLTRYLYQFYEYRNFMPMTQMRILKYSSREMLTLLHDYY